MFNKMEKNNFVGVRFENHKEELEMLDELVERKGTSRSDVIRRCVKSVYLIGTTSSVDWEEVKNIAGLMSSIQKLFSD